MRNAIIALLVVGVPLAIVYTLFIYAPIYGPMWFPEWFPAEEDDSVLDRPFSSMSGGKIVTGGGNYTELSQEFGGEETVHEKFYHNLNISEVTNKHTEFYDVTALDPQSLREEIMNLAPENSNTSRKSITKVTYSVDWSLDTQQTEEGCELYGAKIITNITTTIPRWIGIENQAPEVQAEWDKFMAAVSSYEKRHNHIMERVSNNIANKIKFVPRQALCSDLLTIVNKIGVSGVENAKSSVRRYQSETGGGRYMGVQMPKFQSGNMAENVEVPAQK